MSQKRVLVFLNQLVALGYTDVRKMCSYCNKVDQKKFSVFLLKMSDFFRACPGWLDSNDEKYFFRS